MLTPASAFRGTKLLDNLVRQGVQFVVHGEEYKA